MFIVFQTFCNLTETEKQAWCCCIVNVQRNKEWFHCRDLYPPFKPWCCSSLMPFTSAAHQATNCLDVRVVRPAVSTVLTFWCSSVRTDKTPCSGFICVFHRPPHSEGSTFWSSCLRHTSELNKPPHGCELGIVYKSTVKKKKRGKRLMLRKFPEFEFAHSSTVTANIFPTLHTMNFCTFQGHNVHLYRFHWFLPDPWPLWLCCIVWTDYRNIKRLFACGCVKPWGEVNRDRLMSSFNVPEFQHFLRRNSCSVSTHTQFQSRRGFTIYCNIIWMSDIKAEITQTEISSHTSVKFGNARHENTSYCS